jgi:hypothetical protein
MVEVNPVGPGILARWTGKKWHGFEESSDIV